MVIELSPAAFAASAAAPTFSPSGGTYTTAQTVTLSTTTSGASINYTTDGSTPSNTVGNLYTGPITVNATTTIKAVAFETGLANSSVSTATYTIKAIAPTFSPSGGTYTTAQTVTLSTATSGASINYTTDGSTPSNTAGNLYTGPITVNATTTIKAVAFETGLANSSVSTATYTVKALAPTFSPSGGTYTTAQTVTLSTATSGASINYTTDGSTPSNTVGTLYTGPITVSATTTVKAVAYETGLANSSVSTARYVIQNGTSVQIVTSSLPNGVVGSAYSGTVIASGGTTPYTWSITQGALPNGLSLNSGSGAITGTPATAGTSGFTVQVADARNSSAAQALSITISAPLSIATASLPNGVAGSAYGGVLIASGGTTPYTWSITQGALPNGLSLNSIAGAITGTPTTAGTSGFTVQVTDAMNSSAAQALSITVTAPLSITTASLPNGSLGSSYTAALSASGGVPPYSWSITQGALPAGLSLNPTMGVISGTPSGEAGTSSFTVQVTDASSATASQQFTIQVVTLAITPTTLPNAQLNVFYTRSLHAVGGTPPYAWSWSRNSPSGLSLDPNHGVISGTPTVTGTSSFTVQVADSNANTTAQAFTVAVVGLTVTGVSPNAGVAGTQVTISGSGFGLTQGSGVAWLGTAQAAVVSWSDTQIVATVAPASVSGTARVGQMGVWSNSVPFSVSTATISSVTPAIGVPGTQVTITGSYFGSTQGSGQVWLGTAPATVQNWSDTQIVALVSAGALSGNAQVVQNGVLSNAVPFIVDTLNLASVAPNQGAAGTSVTFAGTGFGSSQGNGIAWLGNAPGQVVGVVASALSHRSHSVAILRGWDLPI